MDSLKDLCDHIKHTIIRIMGVSEEEEKKKGMKKFLMRLELKISPTWKRNSLLSPRGTKGLPYRINPRRNTPRHILIKLAKTKHKEKNIKSSKGEATSNVQGKPHTLKELIFQQKLHRPEGNGRIYLKY